MILEGAFIRSRILFGFLKKSRKQGYFPRIHFEEDYYNKFLSNKLKEPEQYHSK